MPVLYRAVRTERFELSAFRSQTERSAKLSYTRICRITLRIRIGPVNRWRMNKSPTLLYAGGSDTERSEWRFG